MPTVLAKVGVIKRIKRLESKSKLNNGTSGGTMPTVLAKLGIMKELKNLEINCNPTTNGTSGGTMPSVLAKLGVKGKARKQI
jgi:hypothetical protein